MIFFAAASELQAQKWGGAYYDTPLSVHCPLSKTRISNEYWLTKRGICYIMLCKIKIHFFGRDKEMNELFNKKEINPTVKVVISMNQDEKQYFKNFAAKAGIPFSALVRIALKNFMTGEGKRYVEM